MANRSTSGKVAGGFTAELGDWDTGPGPTYRRLARAVAGAVERGALPAGRRLPSERGLAMRLAVSRGTVVAAYDALLGDGLVERRHGSGTFVAGPTVPEGSGVPADREGSALVAHLADAAAPAATDLIDLSLSVVHDARDLDLPTLDAAALAGVIGTTGYAPWGLPELRMAVAAHISGWGLPTDAGQVVITTGAQQAIAAAAACWLRPGDTVVCEDPTYPGAIAAFRQAGARLVGVPVDRHGVVVDELRAALAAGPSLVYLQPSVHSPTGAVLAERRRAEIAALVRAARVPLVEDHALADTAWSPPPPPIARHAADASIAVVGSLSKLFWGGLRVGFVRAPVPLAQRLARVKATFDLGSSVVPQLMAARLLADRGFTAFAHRRRQELAARAERLADGLRTAVPGASWPAPAGGLSLWVRVPEDAAGFVRRARAHGVVLAESGPLHPAGEPSDHVRLSFAAPPWAIEEAVRRLATATRSRR